MKKLIAIVLAIACVAALMLTGCGNNNAPQPEPQPTELTGSISTDGSTPRCRRSSTHWAKPL